MENQFNLPEGNQLHINRYVKFILSRPKRKYKPKSGLERHHILPKAFGADKSYTKKPENIIVLTNEEHCIAHLMLYKAYEGLYDDAMTFAFYKMVNCGNFKLTAKQYKKLKNESIKKISIKAKERMSNPKNNPFYGKHHDKETKIKIGNRVYSTGRIMSDYQRLQIKKANSKIIINISTKEIFVSIMEASKKCNISYSSLTSCCEKRSKSAGGYLWCFLEDYDKNKIYDLKIKKCNERKVILIETGEIFNSIKEASKKCNINRGSIGQCCLGYIKTAGKVHWKYKD